MSSLYTPYAYPCQDCFEANLVWLMESETKNSKHFSRWLFSLSLQGNEVCVVKEFAKSYQKLKLKFCNACRLQSLGKINLNVPEGLISGKFSRFSCEVSQGISRTNPQVLSALAWERG